MMVLAGIPTLVMAYPELISMPSMNTSRFVAASGKKGMMKS